MSETTNNWSNKETPPDEVNVKQNVFSVDVLVYFIELDEHTIGWFEYSTMKWLFLSDQDYRGLKFKWRYFRDEIDKYKFQK